MLWDNMPETVIYPKLTDTTQILSHKDTFAQKKGKHAKLSSDAPEFP